MVGVKRINLGEYSFHLFEMSTFPRHAINSFSTFIPIHRCVHLFDSPELRSGSVGDRSSADRLLHDRGPLHQCRCNAFLHRMGTISFVVSLTFWQRFSSFSSTSFIYPSTSTYNFSFSKIFEVPHMTDEVHSSLLDLKRSSSSFNLKIETCVLQVPLRLRVAGDFELGLSEVRQHFLHDQERQGTRSFLHAQRHRSY